MPAGDRFITHHRKFPVEAARKSSILRCGDQKREQLCDLGG